MSRLIKVFLILCMGWQSLAFAGFDALVAHANEEQHALLHFQGVAHHHDDHAEDFHEDDSIASTLHALSDASQFSPALPSPQTCCLGITYADQPSVERVHSRGQLLDRVWGDHVFIEERTVDVHVKRLREALGAAGNMVETVRGAGYRFTEITQTSSAAG